MRGFWSTVRGLPGCISELCTKASCKVTPSRAGLIGKRATICSTSLGSTSPMSLSRRSFATMNRPPRTDGSQGRRKLDEPSDLVVNVSSGERMPASEYVAIAKQQVLRVLVDGSKQEMTLQEAVEEAREMDLDPVLVSRDSTPLVIKIMDSGKARHDLSKKLKDSVKKSVSSSIKELRVGLKIGQHDLDVKLKQAREFFEKGHRVKLFIQLRGADYYNAQQQACDKVDEISNILSSVATREGKAALLGNVASVMLVPLPKKATPPKPVASKPATVTAPTQNKATQKKPTETSTTPRPAEKVTEVPPSSSTAGSTPRPAEKVTEVPPSSSTAASTPRPAEIASEVTKGPLSNTTTGKPELRQPLIQEERILICKIEEKVSSAL